jgi:uncharacterized protein
LSPLTLLFLFLAAAFGGALNSVVGGGTFVVFPAMMFAGIPAVMANATAAIVLWPGSLSSAFAYRQDIKIPRRLLVALLSASLIGGTIGGLLLIHTPSTAFMHLVPWLLLFATLVLSFGRNLIPKRSGEGAAEMTAGRHSAVLVTAMQFVISVYGGYFGAGMGILMLAALTVAGIGNIHVQNGVRSLLAVFINGVAQVIFIFAHAVAWRPAVWMIIGATLAGYFGAAIARKIHPPTVRRFVLSIAWAMTVYYFAKNYHLI